ncbi:Nuc-1 negative regulatory protein preg [Cladobotryum mycophilum]|uniref:Nuc-1 negative regulatory protein preg n=1 Tax=Cladobotryum mycophilum TaxID=491253 RepID=A0ABR0T1H3_9HYPO
MLKTSPIISPSATASPTTNFHHAPSRSSQESITTSATTTTASRQQQHHPVPSPKSHRRPSSRSTVASANLSSSSISELSMTTAPQQRSQDFVPAVPAAAAAVSASASAPGHDAPRWPGQVHQHHHHNQPMTTTTASTAAPAQTQSPSIAAQTQSTLSPNKRRSHPTNPDAATAVQQGSDTAPDPASVGSTSDSAAQQPSSPKTSKRAKPAEQPPKVLPQRYELCAVEHMVELIAHMLGELIATNDAIRISSGGLTRFHSRTAPGISVRDYLHRLARHATLTPPLLLAMVYYIDRLCALYQEFTINTLTVHRFLITAATVAAKGLSDSFWNNTTYARVGGVRVAELKLLELEFLYRVDWKIVPNPEVLVAYYQGLVQRCPGYALESDGTTDDDEVDEDEEEEEEEDEE